MKYLVVGDTHIGVKKSSKAYHEIVIDLFYNVCEYAKEHNITHLIQLGDLFDNRKALTHSSIECALAVADMVSEVFETSYFIVGNHDTSSKDTMFPHSLMIFNEHKSIKVVDSPRVVNEILMLPWLFDETDMIHAKVCIGHFDINGAMMNTAGTISKNHRLNFSNFEKYLLTLSGHYHTPNSYQHNVRYIGSPYQLTFNDRDSVRGFYELDVDKLDSEPLTFIPFDRYPKHHVFNDKSTGFEDHVTGNIINLTFTEDYGMEGNKEIIEKYKELRPFSLRVKYARVDDGMTDEKIDETELIKSTLDVLNEYHEKADLPEGINLVILNKVSESIYKEMSNV